MKNSDAHFKPQHLFFIGIVGHAMRGIAAAAKSHGHYVTGLDEQAAVGPATEWLAAHGILWQTVASPNLLDGVDLVIISGATPKDHILLREARTRNIRVISFAQYLGEFTAGKQVLAVAGTHGKTTTTSLITWLLESAGRKPDYLIGIRPFNFDSSARLDGADIFVVEGDEYRASHLDDSSKIQHYHPDTVVLTSVEHDHPDSFPSLQAVIQRFKDIVAAISPIGRLIAWAEDPNVSAVARAAHCRLETYGLEKGDYRAKNITYTPQGLTFDAVHGPGAPTQVSVPLYGKHNVLNTLAAIAAARAQGLRMEQIVAAAARFKGAFRRFQLRTTESSTVTIVDDYAHHPTEVKATLEAAKAHFPGSRILAIFVPHTFSRTQALLSEYTEAFNAASQVYIGDIEGARETNGAQPISSKAIIDALPVLGTYAPDRDQLIDWIMTEAGPGDVIVCMSVSGWDELAGELAARFAPEN